MEREFVAILGVVRQARVLAIIKEPEELLHFASLPASWVLKPVGGAVADGICLARNGMLVRDTLSGKGDGIPTHPGPVHIETVVAALRSYQAAPGGSGRVELRVNASSFLLEEYVQCESGQTVPIDYRVCVCGERILFVWATWHQSSDGAIGLFDATMDAEFRPLPSALNKVQRDSRAREKLTGNKLAWTDGSTQLARPACWDEMMRAAQRLGGRLGVYARLDFFASEEQGALLSEITFFQSMHMPADYFSLWANRCVRSAWVGLDGGESVQLSEYAVIAEVTGIRSPWVEPDGCLARDAVEAVAAPNPTIQGPGEPATEGALALHISSLQGAIAQYSDSRAVVSTLTNSELLAQLQSFDLGPWGVELHQRVAILIPNDGLTPTILLSVMNRYCAVPLNPESPASELAQLLHQSRSMCVLCIQHGTLLDRARAATQAAGLQLVVLERRGPREGCSFALPTPPKSPLCGVLGVAPAQIGERRCNGLWDVILLLTTSGTAGRSKKVPFTLERLLASGGALAESMQLCRTDCGLNMMPMHHIGGIACNLIAPLLSHGCCLFTEGFSTRVWFDSVQNQTLPVTWCYAVPSMWVAILKEASASWSRSSWHSLRLLRSGAAALPHSDAQRMAHLFGPSICVLPTYSMTECMPIASPPLNYSLGRNGSVGTPMLELCVLNVSTDIKTLPGQVGEISLVRGAQLFSGYDFAGKENSIDAAVCMPNVASAHAAFRTGDLGYLSGDGWLYITGRSELCIPPARHSILLWDRRSFP